MNICPQVYAHMYVDIVKFLLPFSAGPFEEAFGAGALRLPPPNLLPLDLNGLLQKTNTRTLNT